MALVVALVCLALTGSYEHFVCQHFCFELRCWGGFNAQGGFALKLWTLKAKMTKEDWKEHVPALKRAAAQAGAGHGLSCFTCVFGLDELL